MFSESEGLYVGSSLLGIAVAAGLCVRSVIDSDRLSSSGQFEKQVEGHLLAEEGERKGTENINHLCKYSSCTEDSSHIHSYILSHTVIRFKIFSTFCNCYSCYI